eukprot:gene9543-biopygen3132
MEQMYILEEEGGTIVPFTEEWLSRLSLRVFEGEFSCCTMDHRGTSTCDKEALMPPVLG